MCGQEAIESLIADPRCGLEQEDTGYGVEKRVRVRYTAITTTTTTFITTTATTHFHYHYSVTRYLEGGVKTILFEEKVVGGGVAAAARSRT